MGKEEPSQVMPDPWRKRKQGTPALRRFQVEQPQARPTVFHETRITAFMLFTNHETRLLWLNPKPKSDARTAAPAAQSLLSCALWSGYGAAWAAAVPAPAARPVRFS